MRLTAVALLALFAFGLPTPAAAQEEEPPTAIVSIYHIAPAQHVAFLEWMAEREDIARQAGVPTCDWYAHVNGAAWDFLAVCPPTTEEQDDAVDAATEAAGLATGPPAAVEIRRFVASHTDTEVAGPMTSAELLAGARGN